MLRESGFLEAGAWRYLLGVITLLLISLGALPSYTLFKRNWRGALLVGLIGLFGFNLFFFLGINFTSPINAALIVSLNPATTIILSYFLLRTSITKNQIVGTIISLVGVLYLLSKGNLTMLSSLSFSLGDLLILVANILFALHHVWVKKYTVDISNKHFTTLTGLVCATGFVIALIIVPDASLNFNHSTTFWISAFGIGSFGTSIAYLLWNKGVTIVGADKAGIFMNFVPMATAISALFFGQQLYLFHYISGAIITAGMVLSGSSLKVLLDSFRR